MESGTEGVPVAPEEGGLGERGEEASLFCQPDRDRRAVADIREEVAVDEDGHVDVEGLIADLEVDAPGDDAVDHVLGRFRPGEKKVIADAVLTATQGVALWVRDGIEKCMNQYNAAKE